MKKTIKKVINDLEVGFKVRFEDEGVHERFIELLNEEGIENEVDEEGYLYWTYSIEGSTSILSECIVQLNEELEEDYDFMLNLIEMLQLSQYY